MYFELWKRFYWGSQGVCYDACIRLTSLRALQTSQDVGHDDLNSIERGCKNSCKFYRHAIFPLIKLNLLMGLCYLHFTCQVKNDNCVNFKLECSYTSSGQSRR